MIKYHIIYKCIILYNTDMKKCEHDMKTVQYQQDELKRNEQNNILKICIFQMMKPRKLNYRIDENVRCRINS